VGVVLDGLAAAANTTAPLFEDDRRRQHLSAAMDRINERFGANAAHFGAMHGVPLRLTPRIAFTRIPDPGEPDD
jgi:DNA polymerase IV